MNAQDVKFSPAVLDVLGQIYDQGHREGYNQGFLDALDKIRVEIEEHAKINQNLNIDRTRALCWCLDVIDKYKAESEGV